MRAERESLETSQNPIYFDLKGDIGEYSLLKGEKMYNSLLVILLLSALLACVRGDAKYSVKCDSVSATTLIFVLIAGVYDILSSSVDN